MADLKVELFDQTKEYPDYTPTDDEKIKIDFVRKRFRDMQQSRSLIDQNREIYQKMIDAVLVPYGDERSSSNVPLASSLIELFVAEATKINTEWLFKSEVSSYSTQAKALEYVWKYDRRRNNRKKQFIENEYITAWFWWSVIYTGFESYDKVQKDMVFDESGNMVFEEKIIKKEEIIVKNVDIRDFYLDNQAVNGIDDASDCYYRQWISYEKFKNFETNDLYKNIDKVAPRAFSNEWRKFMTQEDLGRSRGDFVLLEHYWNVEKDCYIILGNGVLIREQPMVSTINWEKALPFVVRVLGKKNYNYTGRGLCEAVMMFNSEINNLRELCMDAIRRSNVSVLAIGNWLSFNGRDFSYDNEILTFDGKLDNSTFQQISGTPPNQAIFWYMDRIMKDISIFIWIDIQNIMGDANLTAFQTEVKRDASQKRVNVWLTNRDLAFERFANLHKDNLQTFFPRKNAEWLYPVIEVEGEELKTNDDGTKKFKKKKWKSIFEVTPEMLRGDIYIDVYTNTTAPTVNAVDRQQKLEVMQAIWPVVQWFALAKQAWFDLDSVMPLKKTIKDLMDDYNFEVQGAWHEDQEDIQKAKDQLRKQLSWMLTAWIGGWQPQPEVPQEQPPLPTNPIQSWQAMLTQL